MLTKLIETIKGMFQQEPDKDESEALPKRQRPTQFQAAWDILKLRRQRAGQVVSGETRRALRAHLKAYLRSLA